MQTSIQFYHHSEINGIGNLHAAFTTHCTLDWIVTVLVTNKVGVKMTKYRISSAFFTMENKSQQDWYFNAYLLTLLYIDFLKIRLDLIYFLVFVMHPMKTNNDIYNRKKNMRRISFVVLIWSKILLGWILFYHLPDSIRFFWLILCDWYDENRLWQKWSKKLCHEDNSIRGFDLIKNI